MCGKVGQLWWQAECRYQEWEQWCRRDQNQVPLWLELFSSLRSLVVIHSRLEAGYRVVRTAPVLEMVAGSWLREKEARVPDVLLQMILQECKG